MIQEKIAELKNELAVYEAMCDDFVVKQIGVVNTRTDAVYEMFCVRHPEVVVSQRKFSALLCKELGLKSVQGWLDGVRGSFYE